MHEHRLIYVLNPLAAGGKYTEKALADAQRTMPNEIHQTEGPNDCANYVAEMCVRDPDAHFVIYGGNGTASEAAQGILSAGAGDRALFSVVPIGYENDFARGVSRLNVPEGETFLPIDILSVNGRAVVNMLHIGFPCEIVTEKHVLCAKKFLPRKLAYSMALNKAIKKKYTLPLKITLTTAAGEETLEGDFLFLSCGCFPYCGGDFTLLPAAGKTDGTFDMLLVRDFDKSMKKQAANFHTGEYLNCETLTAYPPVESIVTYRKCTAASITGFRTVCEDGELTQAAGAKIAILPKALRYMKYKV